MALYGEETALGKMLAKVKIFSRAARIMMLVRRALAAMSWPTGNAMPDFRRCLAPPTPTHISPMKLETYLQIQEVELKFMSLQMSSCLSYSFVTYPSPKLIFKATLIKQNESSTLCPVPTNFYSLFFFSKVYLILEVTNSLTFYLWALVCGFWSFPRSTEQ